MGIPEPAGPLWAAVKAVYDPWPADDEGVAADLAGAWRGGGTVLAQGAADATRAGEASLAAWRDAAGEQFHGRVGTFAADLGRLQQNVTNRAAHAEYYGAELASAKNAIVTTIAQNENVYALLGNPLLGAAGPVLQTAFAAEIATALQTMIAQKAAALRGYPADGPPPVSNFAGDLAGAGQGGEIDARVAALEQSLRDAGLLTGPPASGHYRQWLENAVRRDVPIDTIKQIARDHHITPEDFAVLAGLEEIREDEDRNGIFKSYFLMPTDISGDDAAKATRMTYLLNAGTDYGTEGEKTDFAPTPYGSEELRRITDRQQANWWSYTLDVDYVHDYGGRLVTTPNGIMMGVGGNGIYSQSGGTAWGDTFMLNIDPEDPAQQLRETVTSGDTWYHDDTGIYRGNLDLDRLLHHEERHSQQWERNGYFGMLYSYATDSAEIEKDAGLSDGGY